MTDDLLNQIRTLPKTVGKQLQYYPVLASTCYIDDHREKCLKKHYSGVTNSWEMGRMTRMKGEKCSPPNPEMDH